MKDHSVVLFKCDVTRKLHGRLYKLNEGSALTLCCVYLGVRFMFSRKQNQEFGMLRLHGFQVQDCTELAGNCRCLSFPSGCDGNCCSHILQHPDTDFSSHTSEKRTEPCGFHVSMYFICLEVPVGLRNPAETSCFHLQSRELKARAGCVSVLWAKC